MFGTNVQTLVFTLTAWNHKITKSLTGSRCKTFMGLKIAYTYVYLFSRARSLASSFHIQLFYSFYLFLFTLFSQRTTHYMNRVKEKYLTKKNRRPQFMSSEMMDFAFRLVKKKKTSEKRREKKMILFTLISSFKHNNNNNIYAAKRTI